MKILVSACLLGENCKYNGGNNYAPQVLEFLRGHAVTAVCPELLAGLGVPRTPIEIVDGVLLDREGRNVDGILRGAVKELTEKLATERYDCAILQSRSPTCGVNQVYDGTFSGVLVPGMGVFAAALKEMGIRVLDAEDLKGAKSHEL